MKKKATASETWDDLVFENRHKDYGAYAVRRHYSQSMTAGLGVSVSLACLLLALPKILSMFGVNEKIIPGIPVVDLKEVIKVIQPPPIDIIEPIAPPPAAHTQPLNNNVTPQITSTAPMDNNIPTNDQVVTSSSEPGTGEGPAVETTGDGPGVIETVAPVVGPPPIFVTAEVMPQYEGGLEALAKFIQRKVRTPRSVSSQGVSGTVFVEFVVRSDGSITDVKIVRGIAADCDREAIRLVSMMKDWKAGMQNHQPVSVRMVLPIKFQSQTAEF